MFRYLSVVAVLASSVPVAAQDRAPDLAWWATPGSASGVPDPTYRGVARQSFYIPMRDGIRLAIDLYLPEGLEPGVRLPTILEQTRYRRGFEFAPEVRDSLDRPKLDVREFVTRGYAYVIVDVRGSGASFGGRIAVFHELEVRDGYDVAEWIVQQPWSDGIIGAQGISYLGTTADLILVNRHPAVKAIAPTFALYDIYPDIVAPGGVMQATFIRLWGEMVRAMDGNEVAPAARRAGLLGSRPVDDDRDRSLLQAAVADHKDNIRVDDVIGKVVYRDDLMQNKLTIDATSTHSFRREQEASGAAIYGYSGWWDGGYANSAIKRFLSVRTPGSRLILGPWSHGGRWFWTPGMAQPIPSSFDRVAELIRFFEYHLRGRSTGIEHEPVIHYFTMGENRWKTSAVWPVVGTRMEPWYFGANKMLTRTVPVAPTGSDRYTIDSTSGSGTTTRWNSLMGGGPVFYPDRSRADVKLLTYTSNPIAAPLEVTGHPMVTIHVSSDATDGAFFVYLEEVFPDGVVGYVTEGQLRAIHRATAPAAAPYTQVPPYRTFNRNDAAPLVPGEVVELTFDLLPTSHQFRAGSRIRIAIGGADRDHFARVPADRAPTVRVHRTSAWPSRVVLPVVRQAP